MRPARAELVAAVVQAKNDMWRLADEAVAAIGGVPPAEQAEIRKKYRDKAKARIKDYKAALGKFEWSPDQPHQAEEHKATLRVRLTEDRHGRPEPALQVYFAALEELDKP